MHVVDVTALERTFWREFPNDRLPGGYAVPRQITLDTLVFLYVSNVATRLRK